MRGPKSTYAIQLKTEEVEQLHRILRAHHSSQTLVVRARIVLNVHEHPEWSAQQIAQRTGTSDRMVRKWRKRWLETHTLADAPRSGAPRHFSPSRPSPSDRPSL
jgi:DNA-directed RNA polymerase specialized sigma24 family protein